MTIEKAIPTDSEVITELTLRSKAYWNYDPAQVEAWRGDLTVSAEYIEANQVYKLMLNEECIGFYAYRALNDALVKLDFLFVEPKCIGKGYGKVLMNHCLQDLAQSNYQIVRLDADPNAEAFYKRCGFEVVGQLESSIKDRFLPIMEKKV